MSGEDTEAIDIEAGWIWVPPPAAPHGWREIATVEQQDGSWTRFTFTGGHMPYVIRSTAELRWSKFRPSELGDS